MQDIRADLQERLEATTIQRSDLINRLRALEVREQRLRALLRNEEGSDGEDAASGPRLRQFILKSLSDGHARDLEDLKKQARDIGLTTAGASGRSLNIVLVNLHRQGLVTRLSNGWWRRQDHGTQLALELPAPIPSGARTPLELEPHRRRT